MVYGQAMLSTDLISIYNHPHTPFPPNHLAETLHTVTTHCSTSYYMQVINVVPNTQVPVQ